MDDMLHVMEWHNGEKEFSPFSDSEMARRQNELREWMGQNDVDASLFTSCHCINYYSGWLYCHVGRKYGMVIDQKTATTISAGIDGGQPWRRSFGNNITYTDWHHDNFYCAVQQLTQGAKRVGVEFDHMSLECRALIQDALPGVELVDVGQPAMWMRTLKSDEEITLIKEGARVCDVGAWAVADAIKAGVAEHEVAIAGTNAMIREIAKSFPFVELMDTWTWFQSGINTDGAHNPVTNKIVQSGDILSLNTFPMIFGYYTALERTLFCDHVDDASLDIWEKNIKIRERGLELIKPGARCTDIAIELNDLYREWDLLKYRSFRYGPSFGVLSHYYGHEAGVERREDIDTELKPGMVVSIEPMVMIPEGQPGAGGYREHDLLVVGEDTVENITGFPIGPDHNVITS
ncbi:M24 family metallopeptidase [Marivita sp. S0852]|uniref:M24 family metallopeptidase n=1 Tax=Marivita sp. S0852 TaxID=3373893 RepID=UPI003982630D